MTIANDPRASRDANSACFSPGYSTRGPIRSITSRALKARIGLEFRRATRKQYSSSEKIRIELHGLRGDDGKAELSRGEGMLALRPVWLTAMKSVNCARRCAI